MSNSKWYEDEGYQPTDTLDTTKPPQESIPYSTKCGTGPDVPSSNPVINLQVPVEEPKPDPIINNLNGL